MASEHIRDEENSGLRFNVGEMRQAQVPRRPQATQRPQTQHIQTAVEPLQPGARGNDPYNTSGSFDRSRNWARVGKR